MKLALAPMQDVTDLAFMRTLQRIRSLPDLFITAYFRSTPTTCALAEANLRCIDENETIPLHSCSCSRASDFLSELSQRSGSDGNGLRLCTPEDEDECDGIGQHG